MINFIYYFISGNACTLARAALLNEIRRFCVLSFPGSISLALGLAYQLRAELRNKGIASYCLCFRFLSRLSMLTIQNVKAHQKPCATLISAQGNHMPKSGPRYPFDRSNFIFLSHTLTILGFHNNWMENSSRMVLKKLHKRDLSWCLRDLHSEQKWWEGASKIIFVESGHEPRTVWKKIKIKDFYIRHTA